MDSVIMGQLSIFIIYLLINKTSNNHKGIVSFVAHLNTEEMLIADRFVNETTNNTKHTSSRNNKNWKKKKKHRSVNNEGNPKKKKKKEKQQQ